MKFAVEQTGVTGKSWLIRSGDRGAVWGKAKERARVFVARASAEAVAGQLAAGSEIALSVVELGLGESETAVSSPAR
jgi:hypothetical protein